MIRLYSTLASAALLGLISACGDAGSTLPRSAEAQTPPTDTEDATTGDDASAETPVATLQTVEQRTTDIDWLAAQRDFAARGSGSEATGFQIQTGDEDEAPPVPVLLPSGLVRPAGAEPPRIRGLSDGYFAKYDGAAFDITISGTNETFGGGAGDRATNDAADPAMDVSFTSTLSGAQLALTRYGAAYLIEFECNEVAGGGADCIDEAEALGIAENLVVARTR